MSNNNIHITQTENRFAKVVTEILMQAGFSPCSDRETASVLLMHRDSRTYSVEIKYSRTRVFPAANAVPIFNRLELLRQACDRIPLVVAGGEVSPAMKSEFQEVNPRTAVLDIVGLLSMALNNRELYDELAALLPYSVSGLVPQDPMSMAMPGWNTSSNTDPGGHLKPVPPYSQGTSNTRGANASSFDSISFGGIIDDGSMYKTTGNYGTGKSDTLRRLAAQTKAMGSGSLQAELTQWQGGRGTALSIQYEKLCTRVLKRLFSDDLTLWQEQAKSNDELYRFDLICKIKRDNHKDFWEMTENHFHSKYIIFEFKNYSGKVTQMEVTTTARYLYTKALRSVAIIVSPNGFNEHADKAARGALREEGKLILALTNAELVQLLQMQDNGDDPADYLSDKLDALLIDLEK